MDTFDYLAEPGGSEAAGPSQPAPESRISNFELEHFTYQKLAQGMFYRFFVGEGGFGMTFKATLLDEVVVIKKLKFCEQQGKRFDSEISVLAKLIHPNLVNILGYCCEDTNRIIVSEFVPNKSLASHLYVDCNKPVLDWSKRMKIVVGAAEGIAYLHNPVDQAKIIHRDIKSKNILLDNDFNPKIADFGLAQFMGYKSSYISTDFSSNSGYVAPECGRYVTEKSDVFSFGILLLEVVTGRKHRELWKWVVDKLKDAMRTKTFVSIVDAKLTKYDEEEVSQMIYCAAACVFKPEKSRPTMSQIVDVLQGKMRKELIWHPIGDGAYLRDPYEARGKLSRRHSI